MKNSNPIVYPIRFLCLALLLAFAGCSGGEESDDPSEDSSKTTPAEKPEAAPSENESGLSREVAQAEAKKFFEKFSLALRHRDAYQATSLVAPSKRDRFEFGYAFWHNCRFFDAKVLKISTAGDLLDVQVSFEWPSGKKEREIKKLKLVEGKWLLLEG